MKLYQVQLSVTTNEKKNKMWRENFLADNVDEAIKYAKGFYRLKADKYSKRGKTFVGYSCFVHRVEVVYHTFNFDF